MQHYVVLSISFKPFIIELIVYSSSLVIFVASFRAYFLVDQLVTKPGSRGAGTVLVAKVESTPLTLKRVDIRSDILFRSFTSCFLRVK